MELFPKASDNFKQDCYSLEASDIQRLINEWKKLLLMPQIRPSVVAVGT